MAYNSDFKFPRPVFYKREYEMLANLVLSFTYTYDARFHRCGISVLSYVS